MPRRAVLALIAGIVALAALAGGPRATVAPLAQYVGSYVWSRDEAPFGGFSALELAPDGLSFVALTDRGTLYAGRLDRNAAGAVTGVETDGPHPAAGARGAFGAGETDAVGLALAPDGRLYVSAEGRDRVGALAGLDGPVTWLSRAGAFGRQIRNAGLEALAVDAEGRLYTLPERADAAGSPFPVWRHDAGRWDRVFTLPREGAFVPVGADFGPDGKLYLLERDFRGFLGFRTRVSRFAIGPDGPGPRELLLETWAPVHDNLEGIALWRDSDGVIRLTMISDDNFFALQHTEFVDYRVGG
jgi:hypothetical protein